MEDSETFAVVTNAVEGPDGVHYPKAVVQGHAELVHNVMGVFNCQKYICLQITLMDRDDF